MHRRYSVFLLCAAFVSLCFFSCSGVLLSKTDNPRRQITLLLNPAEFVTNRQPASDAQRASIGNPSAVWTRMEVRATSGTEPANYQFKREQTAVPLADGSPELIRVTIENIKLGTILNIYVEVYGASEESENHEVLIGYGESEPVTVTEKTTTVTVKAENPVLVHFNLNGGIQPQDFVLARYLKKGDAVPPVETQNPRKTGYTFTGWYADEACEVLWNFENGRASLDPTVLHAGWNADAYTITYYNGETLLNGLNPSGFTMEDLPVELPSPPEKAAYFFAGWYQTPAFEGEPIRHIPEDTAQNKTYYAKWELASYTAANYDSYTKFAVITADQLKELAALSNDSTAHKDFTDKTITLLNDIDFGGTIEDPANFTGIATGSLSRYFCGTFDGGGYKILNMHIDAITTPDDTGLIGNAKNARIKNITLGEGCWVKGDNYVGGIAGYATATTFTNCINSSEVSGSQYVGGIVGNAATNSELENCTNNGAVTGDSFIGGIAGNTNNVNMTALINKGNINGSVENVGGIVGLAFSGTISNSENKAAVSGSCNIGGIAGSCRSMISYCYNEGEISLVSTSGLPNYLSGIVGRALSGSSVEMCYNSGTIMYESSTGTYGHFGQGGIVGDSQGSIKNCYNTGTINGGNKMQSVGGVAGILNTGSISNSYNIANVENTAGSAGSITSTDGLSSNSFWLKKDDGSGPQFGNATNDAGTTPVSNPIDFGNQSAFKASGWDFDTVWIMKDLPPVNGVTRRPVLRGVGEGN